MFFALIVGTAHFSVAEVIFEDNFDAQEDWSPTGTECKGHAGDPKCPDNDVPPGWTFYRLEDKWNPDQGFPNHQIGQRISGDVKRGASGKAWIKSGESSHESDEANYYSDAILYKYLGQEYDEIFVSVLDKI